MMKKAFLIPLILSLVALVACGQIPGQEPAPNNPPQAGMGPYSPSDLPVAPSMPPPTGEILVQEDFSGEIEASWSVLDIAKTPGVQARWYTENGVLVQGGNSLGMDSVDPAYLIVADGKDWTDYTVRAHIYVDTNDEVGLVLRVNEAGFYRFRMRSAEFDGPFQVGFDRYQHERYTVLWHAAGGGFPLRQWFTLQIEAKGGTFAISVDGRPLAVVQDEAFAAGGIGFYAWSEGGAYFDNAIVTR